jgi:hypothetical protein
MHQIGGFLFDWLRFAQSLPLGVGLSKVSPLIGGDIPRYAIKPGGKLGCLPQIWQSFPGAEENFLHQII